MATRWRAAYLPYRVNALRRGFVGARTGASVVLWGSGQQHLGGHGGRKGVARTTEWGKADTRSWPRTSAGNAQPDWRDDGARRCQQRRSIWAGHSGKGFNVGGQDQQWRLGACPDRKSMGEVSGGMARLARAVEEGMRPSSTTHGEWVSTGRRPPAVHGEADGRLVSRPLRTGARHGFYDAPSAQARPRARQQRGPRRMEISRRRVGRWRRTPKWTDDGLFG